jgi:hypothetical protein
MTPCHTNKKKDKRTKRYYYYRCTSTFKKDWENCQIKQINSHRLDQYILDNLKRISLDKQYLDSLCFSLNHGRADGRIGLFQKFEKPAVFRSLGDRAGLELSDDTPPISAEIVAQTLDLAVKSLFSSRGIQRNLLAKKFFKSIIYSKESIQINLFVSAGVSAGENENVPPFGRDEFLKKEIGSPIQVNSNFIIPLIIPNQID